MSIANWALNFNRKTLKPEPTFQIYRELIGEDKEMTYLASVRYKTTRTRSNREYYGYVKTLSQIIKECMAIYYTDDIEVDESFVDSFACFLQFLICEKRFALETWLKRKNNPEIYSLTLCSSMVRFLKYMVYLHKRIYTFASMKAARGGLEQNSGTFLTPETLKDFFPVDFDAVSLLLKTMYKEVMKAVNFYKETQKEVQEFHLLLKLITSFRLFMKSPPSDYYDAIFNGQIMNLEFYQVVNDLESNMSTRANSEVGVSSSLGDSSMLEDSYSSFNSGNLMKNESSPYKGGGIYAQESAYAHVGKPRDGSGGGVYSGYGRNSNQQTFSSQQQQLQQQQQMSLNLTANYMNDAINNKKNALSFRQGGQLPGSYNNPSSASGRNQASRREGAILPGNMGRQTLMNRQEFGEEYEERVYQQKLEDFAGNEGFLENCLDSFEKSYDQSLEVSPNLNNTKRMLRPDSYLKKNPSSKVKGSNKNSSNNNSPSSNYLEMMEGDGNTPLRISQESPIRLRGPQEYQQQLEEEELESRRLVVAPEVQEILGQISLFQEEHRLTEDQLYKVHYPTIEPLPKIKNANYPNDSSQSISSSFVPSLSDNVYEPDEDSVFEKLHKRLAKSKQNFKDSKIQVLEKDDITVFRQGSQIALNTKRSRRDKSQQDTFENFHKNYVKNLENRMKGLVHLQNQYEEEEKLKKEEEKRLKDEADKRRGGWLHKIDHLGLLGKSHEVEELESFKTQNVDLNKDIAINPEKMKLIDQSKIPKNIENQDSDELYEGCIPDDELFGEGNLEYKENDEEGFFDQNTFFGNMPQMIEKEKQMQQSNYGMKSYLKFDYLVINPISAGRVHYNSIMSTIPDSLKSTYGMRGDIGGDEGNSKSFKNQMTMGSVQNGGGMSMRQNQSTSNLSDMFKSVNLHSKASLKTTVRNMIRKKRSEKFQKQKNWSFAAKLVDRGLSSQSLNLIKQRSRLGSNLIEYICQKIWGKYEFLSNLVFQPI